MAYLNLRDRVIETKIAYVGPELSGKATNMAHVRGDAKGGRAGRLEETPSGGGGLMSFDWRPSQGARFNDCDVRVKLVATHGTVADGELERLVVDADGLVLVLDSARTALERNKETVALVRGALAREAEKASLPVVVQLNKRDLPDALAAEEIGVDPWPHVVACAVRGEGVMETLDRALVAVIDSIRQGEGPEPGGVPRGAAAPKVEGNPLLAALRRILETAVAREVAALENRLAERVLESLGRVVLPLATRDDVARAAQDIKTDVELAKSVNPARVDALEDRIESIVSGLSRLERLNEAHRDELIDGAERSSKGYEGLRERVDELDRKVDRAFSLAAKAQEPDARSGPNGADTERESVAQSDPADPNILALTDSGEPS